MVKLVIRERLLQTEAISCFQPGLDGMRPHSPHAWALPCWLTRLCPTVHLPALWKSVGKQDLPQDRVQDPHRVWFQGKAGVCHTVKWKWKMATIRKYLTGNVMLTKCCNLPNDPMIQKRKIYILSTSPTQVFSKKTFRLLACFIAQRKLRDTWQLCKVVTAWNQHAPWWLDSTISERKQQSQHQTESLQGNKGNYWRLYKYLQELSQSKGFFILLISLYNYSPRERHPLRPRFHCLSSNWNLTTGPTLKLKYWVQTKSNPSRPPLLHGLALPQCTPRNRKTFIS